MKPWRSLPIDEALFLFVSFGIRRRILRAGLLIAIDRCMESLKMTLLIDVNVWEVFIIQLLRDEAMTYRLLVMMALDELG